MLWDKDYVNALARLLDAAKGTAAEVDVALVVTALCKPRVRTAEPGTTGQAA
jgi:hypothetical protein